MVIPTNDGAFLSVSVVLPEDHEPNVVITSQHLHIIIKALGFAVDKTGFDILLSNCLNLNFRLSFIDSSLFLNRREGLVGFKCCSDGTYILLMSQVACSVCTVHSLYINPHKYLDYGAIFSSCFHFN